MANEDINIKINNFSYKGKSILENVDVSFERGTINAIVGANGSGKSTFLSIIAKEQKARGYSISFKGSIGYIPQENPLLENSTGYDNLLLWYKGSRSDFKKALESPLIQMLGINDYIKLPIKKMSGGMKKRISIAMALINNPSMILLDEPSAALDLIGKNEIRNYLLEYKKTGGTILIVSHDEDELSICDNIYIVKNKTLVKSNSILRGEDLIKAIKK